MAGQVSYVIPADELEVVDLKGIRAEALELLRDLIKSVGKSPEDYDIRDVLPKTDLGLASETWKISYSAAETWEKKVDLSLPENKFIVFYGYANKSASPKTVAIKFYSGAVPIRVFQVEKIYVKEQPFGYFKPFGFKEGEKLIIEFYGKEAGDDEPMLLGFVAELKGTTLGERK